MSTTAGASTRKRKRHGSKGAKKSKAERLARRAQSGLADASGVSSRKCSNDELVSLATLDEWIAKCTTTQDKGEKVDSRDWDVGQNMVLQIGTEEAKMHLLHNLLWKMEAAKAAGHYTKRLKPQQETTLQILKAETDTEKSMLLKAKFLQHTSTSMLSNEVRLNEFLWPWLQSAQKQASSISSATTLNAVKSLLQDTSSMTEEQQSERKHLQRLLVERCLSEEKMLHLIPSYASSYSLLLQQRVVRGKWDHAESSTDQQVHKTLVSSHPERDHVRDRIQECIQQLWPDARVFTFGSRSTGLTEENGSEDLDLCVLIPSDVVFRQDTAPIVAELKEHLELYAASSSDANFIAITNARVPIVQFQDAMLAVPCELSVNNVAALWNTELIRGLIDASGPLRLSIQKAFLCLKRWRQRHHATFGHQISSYGLLLMFLHYLQQEEKLPVIDITSCYKEDADTIATITPETVSLSIKEALTAHPELCVSQVEPWWVLAVRFFCFYVRKFDWTNSVVNLRQRALMTKKEKNWTKAKVWRKAVVSIEDPIETTRDLGTLFKKKGSLHFRAAIVAACQKLSDTNKSVSMLLDELVEQ